MLILKELDSGIGIFYGFFIVKDLLGRHDPVEFGTVAGGSDREPSVNLVDSLQQVCHLILDLLFLILPPFLILFVLECQILIEGFTSFAN